MPSQERGTDPGRRRCTSAMAGENLQQSSRSDVIIAGLLEAAFQSRHHLDRKVTQVRRRVFIRPDTGLLEQECVLKTPHRIRERLLEGQIPA
jgi:hypothetical protein